MLGATVERQYEMVSRIDAELLLFMWMCGSLSADRRR